MSQPQATLLERAKQGDAEAIAALMNRSLQPRGVTARVVRDNGYLQVHLESEQPPNQPALLEFTRKGLTGLSISNVHTVQVYGMQQGRPVPLWEETLHLAPSPVPERSQANPSSTNPATATPDDASSLNMAAPQGEIIIAEEQPDKKAGLGPWLSKNWWVIPVMLVLAIAGFLAVVFVWKQVNQSQTASQSPAIVPTAASPSAPGTPAAPAMATPQASVGSPQSAAPPSAPAILNQAYTLGMSAAVKTQTATTQADWKQVIADWEQSIQLLESIPPDAPQAAIAQQKIREYQRNLNYAQQRLAKANP